MTKTPSDTPPDSVLLMATPRPPPPPQPGETHGMMRCSMGPPVPAIAATFPAAQRVNRAPFDVDNAPINSDGSTTLLSPGTTADDGFITPRGKTTPIHAAVPQDIATPQVTIRNAFKRLAGSAASNDDKPPPNQWWPPLPPILQHFSWGARQSRNSGQRT